MGYLFIIIAVIAVVANIIVATQPADTQNTQNATSSQIVETQKATPTETTASNKKTLDAYQAALGSVLDQASGVTDGLKNLVEELKEYQKTLK